MSGEAAKAVVLLSGGMDSAVCLAIAREMGFARYALSFRYGQRHAVELEAARAVANAIGVERHAVMDINLRLWGGSALTSDALAVPKDGPGEDIPVTYVPARNLIFLSFAMSWAETLGANDIFIGVNSVDYSGYPDCRPEFIAAFARCAALATKVGVEGAEIHVRTPLQTLSKADIARRGTALGVDFSLTRSCYDPDAKGLACGRCDSCRLRAKGFQTAGIPDPTLYAAGVRS